MATQQAPPRGTVRIEAPDNNRKDAYWLAPTAILTTFTIFVVYSTIRAFMGKYFATYYDGHNFPWMAANLSGPNAIRPHYWSPFYSPYIPGYLPFLKGLKIATWPISAALYVMVFPLAFRASCYYCRKTYYRAVFRDPEACAVKEKFARRNYTGEAKLPARALNFHRYAFYAAVILVFFHWYHLYNSFFYTQNDHTKFGVGLGTIIFLIDTLALTAYTFSCHSWRHLVGGVVNRFSKAKGRFRIWSGVSRLNEYHGQFFWISLVTVLLADLYVFLVSSGRITDLRIF